VEAGVRKDPKCKGNTFRTLKLCLQLLNFNTFVNSTAISLLEIVNSSVRLRRAFRLWVHYNNQLFEFCLNIAADPMHAAQNNAGLWNCDCRQCQTQSDQCWNYSDVVWFTADRVSLGRHRPIVFVPTSVALPLYNVHTLTTIPYHYHYDTIGLTTYNDVCMTCE